MTDFKDLGGVKITGFISPTDTNDTYAVTDPLYGVDSLRNVDLLSDLEEELATHKEKLSEESVSVIQDMLTDLKTLGSKIKEHGTRADNIVKNMLLHSQEASVEKDLVNIVPIIEDNYQIALQSFLDAHGKFELTLEKDFDIKKPK